MDNRDVNLRIRVTQDLKAKLENVCRRKLSSQQDVIETLVEWFVDLDETLQSVILGQIGPRDEATMLKMVLQRLGTNSSTDKNDSPLAQIPVNSTNR
jgi:hypothetical protein